MKQKDKATAQATAPATIAAPAETGSDVATATIAAPPENEGDDASELQLPMRKGGADKRKLSFRGMGPESAILATAVHEAENRGWLPEGTLKEQHHTNGALIALRLKASPSHVKQARDRFSEAAKTCEGAERFALTNSAAALARLQTSAYDAALNGGIPKGSIRTLSAVIFASSVQVSASCKACGE